jgi:hypothetical protein
MRVSAKIEPEHGHQQADMQSQTANRDEPCALPKSAEARIAVGLKQLYNEMLAEPMPDKFAALLQQLSNTPLKTEREP